jgi:hypothetical protein
MINMSCFLFYHKYKFVRVALITVRTFGGHSHPSSEVFYRCTKCGHVKCKRYFDTIFKNSDFE